MVGARLSTDERARTTLGLGLAGVSEKLTAAQVVAALPGRTRARAANGAVTAGIGAHGGADGGRVLAGTGLVGLTRVRGRETVVGGRGFLLGDDGSAARIGAVALRATIRAHDGLQQMTGLSLVGGALPKAAER
jgi:glucosamine kinase